MIDDLVHRVAVSNVALDERELLVLRQRLEAGEITNASRPTMTSPLCCSAQKWTKLEPMNPAAPVTSILRIVIPSPVHSAFSNEL
jgi:hypothetical protein